MIASCFINSDLIAHAVFEAVDSDQYLELNTPVSLEYLSHDQDGIFPSLRSWKSFCAANFGERGRDGVTFYYDGEPHAATIKKYCRPLAEYQNRFVVRTGSDKYMSVDPADLEFKFSYTLYFKGGDPDLFRYPAAIEIFVTASFK